MWLMSFWAFVVVGVVGLGVLVWAWRGRRVGEEPYCRECGFDLRGSVGSERCGECGAELGKRGAVVRGVRRRRWGWVGVSALVVVVMSGPVGVIGFERRGYQLKWIGWYPWLMVEAECLRGTELTRWRMAYEMKQRLEAQQVTTRQAETFAERVIGTQRENDLKWDGYWGDLVERMYKKGVLSRSVFKRYVQAGLEAERIKVPDVLVRGRWVESYQTERFRLAWPNEYGIESSWEWRLRDRNGGVVEWVKEQPRYMLGRWSGCGNGDWFGTAFRVNGVGLEAWPDGEYELEAVVTRTAYVDGRVGSEILAKTEQRIVRPVKLETRPLPVREKASEELIEAIKKVVLFVEVEEEDGRYTLRGAGTGNDKIEVRLVWKIVSGENVLFDGQELFLSRGFALEADLTGRVDEADRKRGIYLRFENVPVSENLLEEVVDPEVGIEIGPLEWKVKQKGGVSGVGGGGG